VLNSEQVQQQTRLFRSNLLYMFEDLLCLHLQVSEDLLKPQLKYFLLTAISMANDYTLAVMITYLNLKPYAVYLTPSFQ
jgi:hypothetical protein